MGPLVPGQEHDVTQNGGEDGQHQRTRHGGPKAVNREARRNQRGELQQKGIQHQQEEPQRQKRKGKGQKPEHRPDGGIDDGDRRWWRRAPRRSRGLLIPGIICATSQSARALKNQLTTRCSIWTSGQRQ